MVDTAGIRIVAIKGTSRPDSYTGKALNLVLDELSTHDGVRVDLIDPGELTLHFPGHGNDHTDAERMRDLVGRATGVVLATPEYHGSYASCIKLVIENLGFPSAMAGKPVALLGVAAGRIGAIKALEHLHSVCSHIGAHPLPTPVSIAGVQSKFEEDGTCIDPDTEEAIRGVATGLLEYIHSHICPRVTLEAILRDRAA